MGSHSRTARAGTGHPVHQGHQLQKSSAPFCLKTSLSPTRLVVRLGTPGGSQVLGELPSRRKDAGSGVWKGRP